MRMRKVTYASGKSFSEGARLATASICPRPATLDRKAPHRTSSPKTKVPRHRGGEGLHPQTHALPAHVLDTDNLYAYLAELRLYQGMNCIQRASARVLDTDNYAYPAEQKVYQDRRV